MAKTGQASSIKSLDLNFERIWEGASEIQRAIIATQLGRRGRAALV